MSKHHRRSGWTGSIVTSYRTYWARAIDEGVATGVPIECGRCHQPIELSHEWDMGHTTSLAEGGDITSVWPEHRHCNRADGARITNNRKRRMRAW